MFFHRLSRIPGVEFVPSNTNTHALSKNAQFVASVSGTVGWEAIRQGTPAMVFGAAWYGSFEGVVGTKLVLILKRLRAPKLIMKNYSLMRGSWFPEP